MTTKEPKSAIIYTGAGTQPLELQILAALPGIAVEVFLQAASVSVSPLGTSEWGF